MLTYEYKIKHKVSGLWQEGGSWLRWSNKGKSWTNLSGLKNHVRCLSKGGSRLYLDLENWEVIKIAVTRREESIQSFEDFMIKHPTKGK